MFKPRYTSEDLTSAIDGLERLERLRDKSEQAARLVPAKKAIYDADFDRYCQAVKSRQKYIIFLQESLMK